MIRYQFRMPLLHDHHTHPLLYASFGNAVSLESAIDKQQALDRLAAFSQPSPQASSRSPGLQLAYGWRSNRYSWSQDELDSLGSIAIFNVSLHDLKLSQEATKFLAARYGDDVHRISDQVWYEQNFRKVLNWFANLNATPAALVGFYDQLETLGVHSAEELLLVDEQEIELFKQANLLHRTRLWASPETYDSLSDNARQHVTGCKLFTDGAIGARTAALSEPYLPPGDSKSPGPFPQGMLVYQDDELASTIDACLQRVPNLAIHAIGDVAIRQTVSALESVGRRETGQVRIEHAQMIDREVAERAKALGLTLSMQPNFNDDSINYADRMSDSFCRLNNPFRMLIDDIGFVPGEDLIFGSDGMPHGVAVAASQCFVTALEHQRLEPEEFVAACRGPFETTGEIEVQVTDSDVNWRRVG